MDKRLTPYNGRVAHVSLRGKVDAKEFVEGEIETVVASRTPLTATSDINDRNLLRELIAGDTVRVLEYHKGNAFVISEKDGYVGWVSAWDINGPGLPAATHTVATRSTHLYLEPNMKVTRRAWSLSFGAKVHVSSEENGFYKVFHLRASDELGRGPDAYEIRYIPVQHLRPIDRPESDPAAVAERLIGTPYLWGGNSSFGIDCSGLVQAALIACATPCPGDSDLQEAAFLDATGPYQRGDLLFWKGHVAMVTDPDTIIHANAYHMAVTYEPIAQAIARIAQQGDGPVTSHKRPT
ncbi:MAG: C40 family peptidase [Shimia sp.]|uniref:C40 family peptidase n=1 Tax=unclassified Shimia TaxID=2630038 RepID=UPI0022E29FE7|nr:NlpC/P60 family protein [Shimia sp. Alg240-R146]